MAPVAAMARVPNVMVVNPSIPVSTVPEFIAYARANTGKVNLGSGGAGGPVHMMGALFLVMTGLKLQHVPYRGEALALADLMAGRVHVVFGSVPASLQHIKAGKLRALGVSTATRADALPDIPPIGDFVPGYEASTWYGIAAPRGTPAAIVERLNAEINAGLRDPGLKARLAELGGMPIGGSPDDFGRLIAEDTEKWGKVIRAGELKAK
jgi:tripartite-type tricarboxylate transporter receptor subunit TctC